ncbi:hypothetical protein AVEN_258915-1 [Araneus ventricosus]|uniref:DUF4817 domain-containing protein n=1 Tax=Araneus ventricosus TaxID=182803 RepID=A0A4Y2RK60_ARAVE|nr:hypothetical protein AVEN_258915-1 [Araneus ventricosus]
MAEVQAKSFCVLEYTKCSSVTKVQRAFLRKYGKAAAGHKSILRWFRQFRETGCLLCHIKDNVVWALFLHRAGGDWFRAPG